MRVEQLNYELPQALVARHPPARREDARLMVLAQDRVDHRRVSDLPELLPAGALLVVNDTKVIAARLLGRKAGTGGSVEVLLVRRQQAATLPPEAPTPGARCQRWSAMARASRRLRIGTCIEVGEGLRLWVERETDQDGLLSVLLYAASDEDLDALIEREGHVPLPPYLRREDEPSDRERYQTVFAAEPGAVAAPTAGLHFSEELVARLRARGLHLAVVTLHVGPGTFRPVVVDELDDHPMHAERLVVNSQAVDAVAAARARGAAVIAVGTTVVRALESAADPNAPGQVRTLSGETRLLIQPGYRFAVVDGLITNFHLPQSTLLALVYAFGGLDRVAAAYQLAIAERYRFYSYGDAMFLPRRASWPGAGAEVRP